MWQHLSHSRHLKPHILNLETNNYPLTSAKQRNRSLPLKFEKSYIIAYPTDSNLKPPLKIIYYNIKN